MKAIKRAKIVEEVLKSAKLFVHEGTIDGHEVMFDRLGFTINLEKNEIESMHIFVTGK